jgi:formimidoylglutamate deiminase
MPKTYLAPSALLPSGWAENVLIEVGEDGMIARVTANAKTQDAEAIDGPLIPGMANVHSHAFQRAMAGLTQKAGPQSDSFWSWRELMYIFLERLNPDDIEIIATELYVEMLEAGYTAVGEFHYLHHDPEGKPYDNLVETSERIRAAASVAGIGLTLLPVLYAHSNFGGLPPTAGQRRFINDADRFVRMLDMTNDGMRAKPNPLQRLGVAPHSLRAVAPDELARAVNHISQLDRSAPIHIHAAEQQKEVDDCIAWSGIRPVQWLLDNVKLDSRWCVIHATHMDDKETAGLAQSGAVAGLCPTTESDLGDGLFNATEFLQGGGGFAIGGDSHAGVDPFAELRLFEYGQRLKQERRNVLVLNQGESLGGHLYRAACANGAQALAQPAGSLAVGRRADFVVLNRDDPALMEQTNAGLLDAAIFGPVRAPVRHVMVGGAWQVRDGVHRARAQTRTRYRHALKRLLA